MTVRFRDPARVGWEPEALARRLSILLTGRDEAEWDAPSQKWQLDSGNNYWLRVEENNIFAFSSRTHDPSLDAAYARVFASILMVQILEPTADVDIGPNEHGGLYAQWWAREHLLQRP